MILGQNQQFASPGEALEHYGVKGMRWGVRKEEETAGNRPAAKEKPKSTDSAVPALSEKKQAKVDKFLKRADVMQTQISELKVANEALGDTRNLAKRYERKANNDLIRLNEKHRQRALKDAEAVKKGKLTSNQKKAIVGAVAVTAILGYVAYSQAQQSGAINSWKLLAQARLQGQKVPFQVNKELAQKMSVDDLLNKVAKPVNPGYAKAGGKMNCRRSTYVYELRRRGFDVHATTSAIGWGQSESGVINALTPDAKNVYKSTSLSRTVQEIGASGQARGDKRAKLGGKIFVDGLLNDSNEDLVSNIMSRIKKGKPLFDENEGITATKSSSKKVLAELAKQPNGARGEVLFKFPTFGHSMAYEVVDGTPHIFDSQKGKLFSAATKMVESKWDGFTGAEIRRLDNADLDLNFLTRWATNVGGT